MRSRTIDVGGLNIALYKRHTMATYVELFQEAFDLQSIFFSGELHGTMLGGLWNLDRPDHDPVIAGEIFRFIRIDPTQPWFNVESKEVATDDDMRKISIPDHLLPHLKRVFFLFFPRRHRLALMVRSQTRTMSPGAAKTFFEALFGHPRLEAKFGPVSITVLPDQDQLNHVLQTPNMSKLIIEIVPPNPDDADDEETKVLEKLKKQNARRLTVQVDGQRNEAIKPDEDTKLYARVASSNGRVIAEGHDAANKRVLRSTDEIPRKVQGVVDQTQQTELSVLEQVARESILTD